MAERPSAGDYIRVLKQTVPTMMSQMTELAKAELRPTLKHGGIGAGAFGGAAAIGLIVLKLLMLTAGFALSMFFHEILNRNPLTALTLGFLTTAVLGLVLVAVLALLGKGQISRVSAPTATIAETRATLNNLTNAIELGVTDAKDRRIPDDALQVTAMTRLPERVSDGWSEPDDPA